MGSGVSGEAGVPWGVSLLSAHWPPCALQVSALQQGTGLRDGVSEEEGTMELGPKRLWKVGYPELQGGSQLPWWWWGCHHCSGKQLLE